MSMKTNKQQIMKRAWELKKNQGMGYETFGAALKDAWAEAKGLLVICDRLEPIASPVEEDAVLAMGRLALAQLASYVAG